MISRGFARAKHALCAHIEVKFDWCNRLPWQLSTIGHYDQSMARERLRVPREAFHYQNPAVRSLHHPRVLDIFDGRLTADLEAWLSEKHLDDLLALSHFDAELAMIPVVERSQ